MEITLKNLNRANDFMQKYFIDAGIVSRSEIDQVYENNDSYAMIQLEYYKELSHTRQGSVKNQNLIKERDKKLREHKTAHPQDINTSCTLEQALEVWKHSKLGAVKELREVISTNLSYLGIENTDEVDSDRNLGWFDDWFSKQMILSTCDIPKGYDTYKGQLQRILKNMLSGDLTEKEMRDIFPYILNPNGLLTMNRLFVKAKLFNQLIEYNCRYYDRYGKEKLQNSRVSFIYQLKKLVNEMIFEIDTTETKPLLSKYGNNWPVEFISFRIDLGLVNGVSDQVYKSYQVVA